MKKALLLAAMLVFIFSANVSASEPPEKIILHNAINFEAIEQITGRYASPKEDTLIYLTAGDKSSPVMGIIKANSFAEIVAYELHTFPKQNSFILTKKVKAKEFAADNPHIKIVPPARHDEVYYLAYRGEGYFQAWWKGYIIWLQPKYQVDIKGDELWLCLRSPETGVEGWAMAEKDKWHENVTFAIFFDKIPDDTLNP